VLFFLKTGVWGLDEDLLDELLLNYWVLALKKNTEGLGGFFSGFLEGVLDLLSGTGVGLADDFLDAFKDLDRLKVCFSSEALFLESALLGWAFIAEGGLLFLRVIFS
jgi:hypothetical protein